MTEKPKDPEIATALMDLNSAEAHDRYDAIKKIITKKIDDRRVLDALLQVVAHDPSRAVRNFARSALDTFGVEHSEVEKDDPVVIAPKKKASRIEIKLATENDAQEKNRRVKIQADAQKRRDFWSGFWGWFGLNIVVLLIAGGLGSAVTSTSTGQFTDAVGSIIFWVIPLAINFGVMIYYGTHNRSQVVIGMLAAFGSMLVIGLCLSAACFSSF